MRSAEIAIFDSNRPWTAHLMRRLVKAGFRPKLWSVVTGFHLVDWLAVDACIFDVGQPGRRLVTVTRSLAWLAPRYPHVARFVIVDFGSPWEWILREAGAVAIFDSVFDVDTLVAQLQRRHDKITENELNERTSAADPS